MVTVYNGKAEDTLDSLQFHHFCEKVVVCSRQLQPQTLPTTSGAAKFHSQRVYLQVQQWMGQADDLKEEDWGWHKDQKGYAPLYTALLPAPENLLHIITYQRQLPVRLLHFEAQLQEEQYRVLFSMWQLPWFKLLECCKDNPLMKVLRIMSVNFQLDIINSILIVMFSVLN